MSLGKKAKVRVEALAGSVHLLHKHLQELAKLVEECTPAEYKALQRAERLFFALNREVLGVLYAIKGRKEDNSAEAVRKFLEGI
jgi:methylphosphotriester-DNA--protein-cysteine methyltransferase